MQMIADGKIKDTTRISYADGGAICDYLNYILNDVMEENFEILEDTTEEIKTIDKSYGIFGFNEESFAEMKEMVQDIYEKTEELVIAYNKLNNTTYKAENCMTD